MSYARSANHYLRLRKRISQRVKVIEDLQKHDIDYLFDILVMRSALLTDLCGSTSTNVDNWERTILGLNTLDVGLYSSTWKMLRELVTSSSYLNANREDRLATLQSFKRTGRDAIYRWIVTSVCGLVSEGLDWFSVNQWITFDEKVNLQSLNLERPHFQEYLEFESQMINHFDRRDAYVVRSSAEDLFGSFNLKEYDFRPRHSNGATSELERRFSDSWHKNRYFRYDGEIVNYLKWRLDDKSWRDWFFYPYKGLDRTCKLVAVPKSMRKNRLISKEPTMLQFLQQDIFAALDDYFCSHECHINLHDLSKNHTAALSGSLDGSYATIDLSSASDSVSVALIQEILGELRIYYPLMATRSKFCLVQTKDRAIDCVIEMKKFAPMGSATCFPTECIIFSSICEAAVRLVSGRRRSKPDDFYVYGDDIIIRKEYAREAVRLLESFHFRVNSEKTFGIDGCPGFRESCGIECLNGEIVTPLRLGRRHESFSCYNDYRRGGMAIAHSDFLNQCYSYSFRTLRRLLNAWLANHEWYRTCARITSLSNATPPSPYLVTDPHTSTQYRCYGRRPAIMTDYGYPQYRTTVAVTKSLRRHYDSNEYYTWCLKSRIDKLGSDRKIPIDKQPLSYEKPPETRLQKKWIYIY